MAADVESDSNEVESSKKSRQIFLQRQTQNIFESYLEKESKMDGLVSTSPNDLILNASRAREVAYITQLVSELLDTYTRFDDEQLLKVAWLCPMLSPLIQSNNRAVRASVQHLVSRMFEGPLSRLYTK